MQSKRDKIDKLNESALLLERLKLEKGWQRERLLVIKSALEGETLKGLSKTFSRSHTTVQNWINRFREGGVERLLDKRKGALDALRMTEPDDQYSQTIVDQGFEVLLLNLGLSHVFLGWLTC